MTSGDETEIADEMAKLESAWRDGDTFSLFVAVRTYNRLGRPLLKWIANGVEKVLNDELERKGLNFHIRNFKHGWRWREVKRLHALSTKDFEKETGRKKTWPNNG